MRATRLSEAHAGRVSRWLAAGLVAAIAAISLVHPPPASAHAQYDHSDPAADAVVRDAPARIDVWFTQELFKRVGANTLEVTDADGKRVNAADAVVDDVDRTHLSVELMPDLAAGVYAVHWTSLSAADGDAADGDFSFTIDPNAPTEGAGAGETPAAASPTTSAGGVTGSTPDASSAPATGGTGGGGLDMPWWALITAAAILGAGAIGAWAIESAGAGREP